MNRRFALLYSEAESACLRRSVVGLAGLGGYGSALVDPLARYELAELRFADPDRYERANMDRQALARVSTLGRRKTAVALDAVADIAHRTRVVTFEQGVTPGTVHRFCCGTDVVIDVCDSLAARLLMHWECSRLRVPLVTGGARSWPSRIGTRVSAHRYDKDERFEPRRFPFREWGIRPSTWRLYREELTNGGLSPSTIASIDAENADHRKRNPPKPYGPAPASVKTVEGGYDPLKVMALAAGLLEETLVILVGRHPRHHFVQRRRQF